MTRRIKLTLEYHGAEFLGWQKQNEGPSVQGHLNKAIKQITGEEIVPYGCGRTDAGVHALSQVCHFDTGSNVKLIAFMDGLNRFTPPSISIINAEEVEEDFHARFSCLSRSYTYLIFNRREPSPHWHEKAGHIPHKININLMQQNLDCLLGEKDFSAFRSSECGSSTPMCHMTRFEIEEISGQNLIAIHIEANHFLHNMVRILVGTLVDIGRGHLAPESLPQIMESKDRTQAGHTVSPHGLYFKAAKFKPHKVLESCKK